MQRRKIITAVLLLMAVVISAHKLELHKSEKIRKQRTKIHPVQKYFQRQSKRTGLRDKNPADNNRLLVMMVEFQEDEDPVTTGNGKFKFDDPDYFLDLGKPPHDQEYYWWILESVRYYYNAASLGAFNLEFDIYPQYNYTQADTVIEAYTLPQEMSYYNPPGADSELMISRFEEYFRDVFVKVDADSTVDFSQYGHFMILHAGADSQHDVRGDSPGDIPSFFIQIGDGKEVMVDDGIVISNACNVPETISQDDQYGLPTAVIAHEFGHSLGFIDLYSTLTGASQTGWFDIMDSGGMGELQVMQIGDEIITLEGALPTLPNAWHRILAWEDYFRRNKMLVDIDELDWSNSIRINPAEKLYDGGRIEHPYFIKIPLTDKEYLLIENRQVDPDGDSGLSFKGALAQAPNSQVDKKYRVLLYPTYPWPDPRDTPNWEYDFFLPGWYRDGDEFRSYYYYGGGLLIWHIDENIIYEQGEWEDGEFYSNYEMNSVNALHTKRGIKIVEADGFDNIGNYNDSYNMLGSAWDMFFKYQPIVTEHGEFLRWDDWGYPEYYTPSNDDEFIHTVSFNGNTDPALITNSGDPGFMGLWNISSYSILPSQERYMEFHYGSHIYDEVKTIEKYDDLKGFSGVGSLYGLPSILTVADGKIQILNKLNHQDLDQKDEIWGNFLEIEFEWQDSLTQKAVQFDIDDDGNDEFLIVSGSKTAVINEMEIQKKTLPALSCDSPFLTENGKIVYPLEDRIVIGEEECEIQNSRIAGSGDYIYALSEDGLWEINTVGEPEPHQLSIYGNVGYQPQLFREKTTSEDYCFYIDKEHRIRKIDLNSGEESVIFHCYDYTVSELSQLLITPIRKNEASRLVYAAGENLFALTLSGALVPGYPIYLEDKPIKKGSDLRSIFIEDEMIVLLKRETGGILAVDAVGSFRQEYSSILPDADKTARFMYDEEGKELNWLSGDNNGVLYWARLFDLDSSPLVSSSWRNDGCGLFSGIAAETTSNGIELSAYAYPNPAPDGYVRFRINGAQENINLKLYDIAGNLVLERTNNVEIGSYQDIRVETEKLSSGVYYARIQSGSKMLTTALGIVK